MKTEYKYIGKRPAVTPDKVIALKDDIIVYDDENSYLFNKSTLLGTTNLAIISDALHHSVRVTDENCKKNMQEAATNNAINPTHYKGDGMDCIDAMLAAYGKEAVMHFCQCNAFKYLWRFNNKNGVEDLDKAVWYINKYQRLTQLQ